MQEWFNWHAWKACVPQKGTGGSNPPLSATTIAPRSTAAGFCFQLSKPGSPERRTAENKNRYERQLISEQLLLQGPLPGITPSEARRNPRSCPSRASLSAGQLKTKTDMSGSSYRSNCCCRDLSRGSRRAKRGVIPGAVQARLA